jgi:hypothetical protein
MRPWPDTLPSWRVTLPISLMIAAGFGLTLKVFYPGIMTFDALYVYEDIAKGFYGDWQSPVMTLLWSLIDPIAPGSGSMLLLTVTFYWLAFGLLALTVARRSIWLAVALPLLALSPPAFVFVGIIWRDVLFASTWLLAAALAFAIADRGARTRIPLQAGALALLALGVLLRPNALVAAPILGVYILWPSRFSWKRAALIYLPAAVGLYGLVQVVYYGALGATRQNPLQSIMVFDLGGITHFTKENQFPVSWSPTETALLTESCYNPAKWDVYWTHQPCRFVMTRLEGEKIFGSPALVDAWWRAVTRHPIAYLEHRAAFMWTFLADANFTMWTYKLNDQAETVFADNPVFMAVKAVHDALMLTPLFRVGTWLLLDIVVCGFAWRRREDPAGAFALGVCGSAVAYVMTLFFVGVASDFRYAYWAVLAGLTGAVAVVWRPPTGDNLKHF